MKYLPHTKHAHILFLLITLILYSSLGLSASKVTQQDISAACCTNLTDTVDFPIERYVRTINLNDCETGELRSYSCVMAADLDSMGINTESEEEADRINACTILLEHNSVTDFSCPEQTNSVSYMTCESLASLASLSCHGPFDNMVEANTNDADKLFEEVINEPTPPWENPPPFGNQPDYGQSDPSVPGTSADPSTGMFPYDPGVPFEDPVKDRFRIEIPGNFTRYMMLGILMQNLKKITNNSTKMQGWDCDIEKLRCDIDVFEAFNIADEIQSIGQGTTSVQVSVAADPISPDQQIETELITLTQPDLTYNTTEKDNGDIEISNVLWANDYWYVSYPGKVILKKSTQTIDFLNSAHLKILPTHQMYPGKDDKKMYGVDLEDLANKQHFLTKTRVAFMSYEQCHYWDTTSDNHAYITFQQPYSCHCDEENEGQGSYCVYDPYPRKIMGDELDSIVKEIPAQDIENYTAIEPATEVSRVELSDGSFAVVERQSDLFYGDPDLGNHQLNDISYYDVSCTEPLSLAMKM